MHIPLYINIIPVTNTVQRYIQSRPNKFYSKQVLLGYKLFKNYLKLFKNKYVETLSFKFFPKYINLYIFSLLKILKPLKTEFTCNLLHGN